MLSVRHEATAMKKNCWEHKRCGRESGGENEKDLGVCPAASESKLDGIHGGINAGRACWVVAGTFCGNGVQGTFAKKLPDCIECDFYNLIEEEEEPKFIVPLVLLNMLGEYKGPFPREE
jgi:hypothetical protein